MMSFFRRMINSKAGVVISALLLATFALLFGMGDIIGLGHNAGGASGDAPINVGKVAVSAADVRSRVDEDFNNYKQQAPQLTLAQYVGAGGFDATLDKLIDLLALDQFGRSQGLSVGDAYVKGVLASAPAFQGADGKFSQRQFDDYLAARQTSYDALKQQLVQDSLAQQQLAPIGNSHIPTGLASTYASLLLERRDGEVGLIPAKALAAGAAPTDGELAAYYRRNAARYTVPERRAIRYAVVSPETVKAQATPSDAEVAAAYQQQRAKYLPAEKRSLSQIVVGDQATADTLAAKIKAGTSADAAAKGAGLASANVKSIDKGGYAAQTSPQIANAVFAAAKGTVVGPVKGPLGFIVAKVETVVQDPGKTLDQAKPEIVAALTKIKTVKMLGRVHDALDDALNGKSSFGDVVAAQKLTAITTPTLTAVGTNPDDPASKPDVKLAPVLAAGFTLDPAQGPQLAPIDQTSFAIVALDHIVPAAPKPLAQIRDTVVKDFTADRAEQAARATASKVVAQVNSGVPFVQALAATGLKTPPIQKISAARAQLAAAQGNPSPPLVMLFNLGARQAKLLEAPDHAAYLIIFLDKITPGNAAGNANVVTAVSGDLSRQVGLEYVSQFRKAVRGVVGMSKNEAALAGIKAALSGQASPDQP
ncbi:MAG: SurA N-terminal domain-containing protein [Sphingomonas sp.]